MLNGKCVDSSCLQASSGGVEAPKRTLEDADVLAERDRILDGRATGDRVQLRRLRKVYATKPPKVGASFVRTLMQCVTM